MSRVLSISCLVAALALLTAADDPGTLTCTPWSWQLCKETGPGVFQVSTDAKGGGGMQAPQHYLNGIFSLDIKLPAGYSGGVNFAWYTMDTISPDNRNPLHSELDMEFYGDEQPGKIMLALNVFANGQQNLAQFKLPFDPSAAFHTYSIKWNPSQIVWLIDGTPIRILNREDGKPWPTHAMKPMATLWATPWTPLKADFTRGPTSAQYGNYKAQGCLAAEDELQGDGCPGPWNDPLTDEDMAAYQKFHDAQLIVDYGWDKA